ncbi:hypothetical protein DICVIV_03007 [Dictyocaulus viviparus]|uniref:Uncharacterized protein n=1 Tax=Dictyocaulus viviparus TaxID=29172 RepID=A0A0D8Y3U8_DICVI|nr:hypothetical protein DICVIV_03007 [Dictyocaulus viviparus]
MESMQSVLPPPMTPGWNDPPNLGGSTPPVATSRLLQLRKRPVDPSLSGGSIALQTPENTRNYAGRQQWEYNNSGNHGSNANYVSNIVSQDHGHMSGAVSIGTPISIPTVGNVATPTHVTANISGQHYQQYNYESQSSASLPISPNQVMSNTYIPQQSQLQFSASNQTYPETIPFSSNYSTLPYSQANENQGVTIAQQALERRQNPYGQSGMSVTDNSSWITTTVNTSAVTYSPTTSSRVTSPGVITTISSSTPSMPSSSTRREANHPVEDIFTVARHDGVGVKSVDPFLVQPSSNPIQPTTHVAWTSSSDEPTSSSKTFPPSIKAKRPATSFDSSFSPSPQRSDTIASLPNCVVDTARRPSTHEGVNYRPITKAPGDVSMSRQQIILCLSTASKNLSPNIYEGVQLRISELKEAIDEGRISERCLKSLNYVVDAIHRENYDDAHVFFDRMRMEFPDEMGPWAQQGIRLLINELRRPTQRIRSAGLHIRTQ